MANAMLYGRQIECTERETNIFNPPSGQTCGEYMAPFLTQAPGVLQNPEATSDCSYCGLRVADQFLASVNIRWSDRWMDFGLMWVYIGFNVMATIWLYWYVLLLLLVYILIANHDTGSSVYAKHLASLLQD